MSHNCPGIGCSRLVADRYLMCRRCWGKLPAELQSEVYATNAKRSTSEGLRAYQAAVRKAIEATRPPAAHPTLFDLAEVKLEL
jgi:hypothetical protein